MTIKFLLKPLLFLVVLVALLGGAELVVRAFFADGLLDEDIHSPAARKFGEARMLTAVEEDGVRYVGTPNVSVTIRDVLYAHNSVGLRGPDFEEPKPDEVFRILLLGDSTTYGWGVSFEDTCGALTEKHLRDSGRTARRCEVINAGVVGYNNGDAEALYRRLESRIEPDLVLLVWYVNDLDKLGLHLGAHGYPFRDALPTPDGWKKHLWRSVMYRRLAVGNLTRRGDLGTDDPGVRRYCAERITALAQAVRDDGRRFGLVDLPWLESSAGTSLITIDGYRMADESAWLADLAESESIPFLSLLPSVAGEHAGAYWYLRDPPDHHPNALANKRFAGALTTFLMESRLVPMKAEE